MTRLSEFTAASAYYETVVDLESDTNLLPGFIGGEWALYVGKREVEASVNFSELDERRIRLSDDGTSRRGSELLEVTEAPIGVGQTADTWRLGLRWSGGGRAAGSRRCRPPTRRRRHQTAPSGQFCSTVPRRAGSCSHRA